MLMINLLLPTDVFPPKCGGAGWSAHALALALLARGHQVRALVPKRGMRGLQTSDILGVPTWMRGYTAPNIPFVQNYFRHEHLWPILANDLVSLAQASPPGIRVVIHAQHVQVTPASILAGVRLGAPVVVTIRDHWPWDYFATGTHPEQLPVVQQTWAALAAEVRARLGVVRAIAALPAIPYMQAHMQRRQAFLRHADAVVAVSEYMAQRLRMIVDPARVHVIPNMVDLNAIQAILAQPATILHLEEPFLLYVGKLERNKGAHLLPELLAAIRRAGGPVLPLIIAGDGALKPQLATQLSSLGIKVRFLEWVEHNEVLRLMARCALLLYPSAWGEPLTRVLLEACACGAPIAAMPTGGTPDIVADGRNGVLAGTAIQLGQRAAEVLGNPNLRQHLATGAYQVAQERFAVQVVIRQFEQLYERLSQPT